MLVAAMNSLPDRTSFSSCSYISVPISERPGTTFGVAVQKPLVREPGWNAGGAGGSSHHKSTERAGQREPKQIQRFTSSYKCELYPRNSSTPAYYSSSHWSRCPCSAGPLPLRKTWKHMVICRDQRSLTKSFCGLENISLLISARLRSHHECIWKRGAMATLPHHHRPRRRKLQQLL
jgi:hypothetical protein